MEKATGQKSPRIEFEVNLIIRDLGQLRIIQNLPAIQPKIQPNPTGYTQNSRKIQLNPTGYK
jgi:hypothetical protein